MTKRHGSLFATYLGQARMHRTGGWPRRGLRKQSLACLRPGASVDGANPGYDACWFDGSDGMSVFRRLLRGHSKVTTAAPAVSSKAYAPLDGSTVRISRQGQVLDKSAQSAGEVRAHYLVVLEGVARGRSIQLGAEPITIGRALPADLVLPDPRVSRSHCRIEVLGDQVIVTDLGSTNGSFMDGGRVSGTIPMRAEGTLEVGQHTLKHKSWSRRELEQWQSLQAPDETHGQQASEIRIEIDETKRRQEVEQITDSLYFRDLADELDNIRGPEDEQIR